MNTPYPTLANSKESDYYTVTQAARVLDVSPSTVWRWIEAKKLPAYRVGARKIRIKKEDLSSIITPARAKGVTMDKERNVLKPIPQEELARRQALVAQILKKSEERSIAPLTTAELVRRARAKERQSNASQ
jgi:excisionase family DNA binding protein